MTSATWLNEEALAIKVEAIAMEWRPSLVGWRPSLAHKEPHFRAPENPEAHKHWLLLLRLGVNYKGYGHKKDHVNP